MQHLPEEQNYPNLVEFLRSGGTLDIGEDLQDRSFARLRRRNKTRTVAKLVYRDFTDVFREMESQARKFLKDDRTS